MGSNGCCCTITFAAIGSAQFRYVIIPGGVSGGRFSGKAAEIKVRFTLNHS
jgi:hypothetical protein